MMRSVTALVLVSLWFSTILVLLPETEARSGYHPRYPWTNATTISHDETGPPWNSGLLSASSGHRPYSSSSTVSFEAARNMTTTKSAASIPLGTGQVSSDTAKNQTTIKHSPSSSLAVGQGGGQVSNGSAQSHTATTHSSTSSLPVGQRPPPSRTTSKSSYSSSLSSQVPGTVSHSNTSSQVAAQPPSSSSASKGPVSHSSPTETSSEVAPQSTQHGTPSTQTSSSQTSSTADYGPAIRTVTSVVSGSTQLVPVFIGGAITSPVPLPSIVTTTLDPTGTAALAGVSSFSAQVVGIFPVIQSWVQNPQPPEATAAVRAIESSIPAAAEIVASLGGGSAGSGNTPCSGKRRRGLIGNLVDSIVDTVRCIADDIQTIGSTIEGAIDGTESDVEAAVKSVTAELENVQPQVDSLGQSDPSESNPDENNNPTNADNPTQEPTQSASKETTGSSSGTTTTSKSSASTVSTTTSSSSSSSCTLAPTSSCTTICSSPSQACSTSCTSIPTPTATSGCGAAASPSPWLCSINCTACLSNDITPPPPGLLLPCQNCSTDASGAPTSSITKRTPDGTILLNQLEKRNFSSFIQSHDPANLTKRTLIGPWDYPDTRNPVIAFLSGELLNPRTQFVAHGTISRPNGDQIAVSSALSSALANAPLNIGLVNLYGCTAVIVMSQQGVWVSHLWQGPYFEERIGNGYAVFDQQQFDRRVLDAFQLGCTFMQHPMRVRGISCHIEDNDEGWFQAKYSPQVVIISPGNTGGGGGLLYRMQIDQIRNSINAIIPGAPVTEVDYISVAEPDPAVGNNPQSPQGFSWPQGKLLFQYDPVQDYVREGNCRKQRAAMRVWVEDRTEQVAEAIWEALPNQLAQQQQKRDDSNDTCPITPLNSTGISSANSPSTTQKTGSSTAKSTEALPSTSEGHESAATTVNKPTTATTTTTALTTITTTITEAPPSQTSEKTTLKTSTSKTAPATAITTVTAPCLMTVEEFADKTGELLVAKISIQDSLYVVITDETFDEIEMGTPIQIPLNNSVKLGYDISVEFTTENPPTKRKRSLLGGEREGLGSPLSLLPRGNSAPSWQNRWVKVTAGPTSWEYSRDVYPHDSERMPICNVSAWEPAADGPGVSGIQDYDRSTYCIWAC